MDQLGKQNILKVGSVKILKKYLVADIPVYAIPPKGLEGPTHCWSISSETYVKRAIANLTTSLAKIGQKLKTMVNTPLSSGYQLSEYRTTVPLINRQ